MEALKLERIAMPRAGPGTNGSMEGSGKFQECVHLGSGLARPGLGRGQGPGGCYGNVSCRYRAMYQYRPQNEDELEMREGDRVDVMQQCDDGVFVGRWAWRARWGQVHLRVLGD